MNSLTACVVALILGISLALIVYEYKHAEEMPCIEERVTIKAATPVEEEAYLWLRLYNPRITEAEADTIWLTIRKTIAKYNAGENYKKGAIRLITPQLILAMILVESGGKESVISKAGAVGLMQVMPFHRPALIDAGILPDMSMGALFDVEQNIRSGIHILMGYAADADNLVRALARYNAGHSGELYGRAYARKVLRIYGDITGVI